MSYVDEIRDIHIDFLKEVGNISSGNAVTSLSQLLNKKINMSIPNVKVLSFNDMIDYIGGAEYVVVSISVELQGDIRGKMYFIASITQAEEFVHKLTNNNKFSFMNQVQSTYDLSALKELGNILLGSYIRALSDLFNIPLQCSIPQLHVDMIGAIVGDGLIEISQVSDIAMIIDTTMNEADSEESFHSHFLLIPDPDSLAFMLSVMGVSIDEKE